MKMKNKRIWMSLIVVLVIGMLTSTITIHAADYSVKEQVTINRVHKKLKKQKHESDKLIKQIDQINSKNQFNRIRVKNQYRLCFVNYVNFYRNFFKLSNVYLGPQYNHTAQKALQKNIISSNMSTNNFYLNNNLLHDKKIQKLNVAVLSYFDNAYNKLNVRKRAWILSPIIHEIGTGVLYSPNNGLLKNNLYFINQNNRSIAVNSHKLITYPAKGVFPYQMMFYRHHQPTYWSIFVVGKPKINSLQIKVQDKTNHNQAIVKNINLDQKDNFGGFKTLITYQPEIPLINKHRYQVDINGLNNGKMHNYRYQFKLFMLK